jgi:hypothetical protein
MAFVQMEAPAFLVGEECLNSHAPAIPVASLLGEFEISDQMDRFLVAVTPTWMGS